MSRRVLNITRELAGRTVRDLLRDHFKVPAAEMTSLLKSQAIRLGKDVCRDLSWRVRLGQRLEIRRPHASKGQPAERKRQSPDDIVILHSDADVFVVEKPAGLTTVRHASEAAEFGNRAKKFLPTTLVDRLQKQLGGPRLRAVHRLDKETSGLVVIARTAAAERHLGLQFRAHSVDRMYLALVRGQGRGQKITSSLVADRGDGRRGSGDGGQHAVTHVRVVECLGDFTLVECRLETGRTHQVRIHLGEQGTPLCGERVYDRPPHGQPVADTSCAKRPMLHAATLGFEHPATKKRMQFENEPPADFRELLKRLRKPNDERRGVSPT